MSTDLVARPANNSAVPTAYSRDWVDLVKRRIAPDATDDELALFLYQCQKTGLDPLARQIYFQKRKNNRSGKYDMTIITGIDGARLTAQRTGEYAGNDDPVFDDEDNPSKATVTVYRIVNGVRCPFTASARWAQYYPGEQQGFMWKKMPHLMLGKCAEMLALRKAFPQELSGVYVKEEMEQAGEPVQTYEPPKTETQRPASLPPADYEASREQMAREVSRTANAPEDTFEIPFGEHGHDQVYTAQKSERDILRAEAKRFGITDDPTLKKISAKCKESNVFVSNLANAVAEWVQENRHAQPS